MANIYENKYIALGVIGIIIGFLGKTQLFAQPYYVIGATALLITAIHYRLFYYIALELILIAGHLAIIFGSGPYTQLALPVLLSIQLFIFYLALGKKENYFFLFLGICGIPFLSIGFAFTEPWEVLVGSFFIALYSLYNGYKGVYPAYLWAVLNSIYILLALTKIILSWLKVS